MIDKRSRPLEQIRDLAGIPRSSDPPARKKVLLRRFFGWVGLGLGLFVVLVGFYLYHESDKHLRLAHFLEGSASSVPFAQSREAASAASWNHRRNEAFIVMGAGAVVALLGGGVVYASMRRSPQE